MNTPAAIVAEQLGKSYSICHQNPRHGYTALRDVISNRVKRLFRSRTTLPEGFQNRETFWALKNVSFEISQGDVVGIIGRNGAGKSTLLKLLSRITEPSEGRVRIKGRIASLLEVGTGFHPELTGRENIFLNGSILGMSRAEIRRKFDEIVCFAEVEKFLDTPVKRYSSGMYVRLAFAVAAHLEPEILVVDEVLAVGDAQFQKKCLGKMQDVSAKDGRTILFVSHNMGAVQVLCNKAIYLQNGQVKATGEVDTIISQYQNDMQQAGNKPETGPVDLGSKLTLKLIRFTPNSVKSGKAMCFELSFYAEKQTSISELAALIYSTQGTRIAILDFRHCGLPITLPAGTTWGVRGEIKSVSLVEGNYQVGLYLNTDHLRTDIFNLASFTVIPPEKSHTPYPSLHRGVVEFDFNANLQPCRSCPFEKT